MEKDLRLEVFVSKTQIMPTQFHTYRLKYQNIMENKYKIIRGASWKVRNYNSCGVFEDGTFIYTTEQVNTQIPRADFELEYIGVQELSVEEHKKIYASLVEYYIMKKLEQVQIYNKYRKYSCKNEITSKWILTEQGFAVFSSPKKKVSLERKYKIKVEIKEDNFAYLYIDTSSNFSTNLTVADYLQKGLDVVGMEVKNDWGKNRQSGIITKICDFTVSDPVDFADSLKAYYVSKGESYRVEQILDNTPVILVKLNGNSELPYYPQALKPILTREIVAKMDVNFSLAIEKYIKRDMSARIELDKDFIQDIGSISQLQNLSFESECCPVERLGYRKGKVELPQLLCANNRSIKCEEKYQVFSHGFYKKPDKKIKIGYLYPTGTIDLIKAVANAIVAFSTKGKFHNEKDKYIREGLLDIEGVAIIKEEYDLRDITDYKRVANKVKKIEGIDMVIVVVPNEMNEDGPYHPFKTIWAEANIPSQMISLDTAKLFANETIGNTSKYYLQNIVLGILGKAGGIPWVVKDMPGNADCFVGLDVATVEKGIHYPACSVVFDKFGRLLGFYKPKQAQKGEKIETKILQDIFDQVIFSYEDEFGESPKSIVIHRDGFSNENDAWYEHYFCAKGIAYTIVEVRKNISSKLVMYQNGKIVNPSIGYCVYNQNKAYVVTTNMKQKKGSPNPLIIEKKCGDISMPHIITQILYLSQLHIGAMQKMRLPITTGYADKICKNREFVPEGKVDNKLFFL